MAKKRSTSPYGGSGSPYTSGSSYGSGSPYGSGSAHSSGSSAPGGRGPRGGGGNGLMIAVLIGIAVVIVALAAVLIVIAVKNHQDNDTGKVDDGGYTDSTNTGSSSNSNSGGGSNSGSGGSSNSGSGSGSGGGTTLPGSPTLVSGPATTNPLAYTIGPESVYIQDIYDFMGPAMNVEIPEPEDWNNVRVFYFLKGDSNNTDDIEEYVNTICDGAHNLELIDKTEFTYDDTFVSYAINYTGTARVDYTQKDNFSENQCNICLYYSLKRGELEGALIVPTSMEVVDLGFRRGGISVNTAVGGPSANAGLYLMPDGSFQTDDGRLTVEVGKATVLRDGETYITDAEFKRGDTEDRLWVRNFYRDETIFFTAPDSRLMTGDIFTLRDLYYDKSTKFKNADHFDAFVYNTPFLGLWHNDEPAVPQSFDFNIYDDATVRIMYWEPGEVGVYYVYAKLSTAPYEIEALIAPSLKKTEGFSGEPDERQMIQGQTITLDCSRKFQPTHETFTWEIVSGKGVVELHDTTSPSCTVTALRSGAAVVRVSYDYGMKEPDALTGRIRTVSHTDIQEFTVYVQ